jgi:histidinol-phosphate aminotransferase
MGERRADRVEAAGTGPVSPESVLRPEVLSWKAYHVPDSAGMLKLDAMENPFSMDPSVRKVLAEVLGNAPINRYPDAGAGALRSLMKRTLEIPESADILLGNGSDELIQILCQAVARPGAVVLGVEPSFVMYRVSAAIAGTRYVGVPLRPDFAIDEGALFEAIETHRPALIFLAYPNNPTGNLFDDDLIRRVIERAAGLVVVDEAYHAFAGRTWMPEVCAWPNLLVMRTLSKLGLAGLRLGYLVGKSEWISELDKVRLPYNINVLTQLAARVSLENLGVLLDQASRIVQQRSVLLGELARIRDVRVFPSEANFVTFRIPDAAGVFEKLRQNRILIKCLHGAHPLLADCLRVTVGSAEDNAVFLDTLRRIMSLEVPRNGG